MKLLSIETSCDETAISLVEITEGKETKVELLANALISQISIHAEYGGVFPVLAKREHQKNLIPLLKKVLIESKLLKETKKDIEKSRLDEAKKILEKESDLRDQFLSFIKTIEKPEIDAIAVTYGPGLEPALWVGINFARALSLVWDIPVIPSNHMEGHILISLLKKESEKSFTLAQPSYPALALLISGGHTELVLMKNRGSYEIVGQTLDDAVGECFDKIARTLGLPYPGGPEISKLAKEAREKNIISPEKLPRPMLHSKDFNFSFSGLKTAVLYLVQKLGKVTNDTKKGIAREAEDAIVDVIVSKTFKALSEYGAQTLIVGGGVIANEEIRKVLAKTADEKHIHLLFPEISHSTDNAFMIALAGYENRDKSIPGTTPIQAKGNLKINQS